MDERSQAPQGENLSIVEMASAYTRFMDDDRKKVNKLLLEEQKKKFLRTIEVNPGGDEMENHEDITLRSGGEDDELNEVEEVEKGYEELVKQVKNEEDSTSPEPEKKNEEVETTPEMTPWAFAQEELISEDIPYILEVEEIIIPLIEYKEASIVNITVTSFEEDVLKLLNGKYYSFLGND